MEVKSAESTGRTAGATSDLQDCLFAVTPNPGVIVGVVSGTESSSLALLAAGVAGMAARRALRERTKPVK